MQTDTFRKDISTKNEKGTGNISNSIFINEKYTTLIRIWKTIKNNQNFGEQNTLKTHSNEKLNFSCLFY